MTTDGVLSVRVPAGLGEAGAAFAPQTVGGDDPDALVRAAAFAKLDEIVVKHGTTLAWNTLMEGFPCGDETVLFASRAEGIFKPRRMRTVLSIKTTIPRPGRTARYADQSHNGGFLFGRDGIVYDFKGSNPFDSQNQLLWEAHLRRLPLIYFFGVAPSTYEVVAPVFVESWDPAGLKVQVTTNVRELHASPLAFPASRDERRYATRQIGQRIHQRLFRERVLAAYGKSCALSRLRLPELIDAAHIIPDADREWVSRSCRTASVCPSCTTPRSISA